jgi:hypothetical protein
MSRVIPIFDWPRRSWITFGGAPTHDFHFPDDSKAKIVEELFTAEVLSVIRNQTRFGATQAPDVLMYKSDLSDWFFCEVKLTDKVGKQQKPKFEAIAQESGKPVQILWFKKMA